MKQWFWLMGVMLLMVGLNGCVTSSFHLTEEPTRAVAPTTPQPPTEPILRLETGMHTATINRIGVDAASRWLVSASDDKTVRLWSLPDMKLEKTLRVPVGGGDEGKLYAVAISPDGSRIAAGGWDWDDSVYLFDRASGRMVRRIGGLGNVILHLAFSADGRYLAATLFGGQGLRVWSTGDWRQVASDRDYGGDSYSADFAADGRLVTTCYDGFIRLYDRELHPPRKAKVPGGNNPFAARFSPDGSRIAVGFDDSTAVNVLDGRDLSLRYAPDTSGVDNGDLSKVVWSADGDSLYAGGSAAFSGYDNPVRRWSQAGQGSYRDLPVSSNVIMDIRPLPDGGMAVGSGDPALTLLAGDGSIQRQMEAGIADYRAIEDGFLLSRDGSRVQFGFELWGKRPASFDLASRSLSEPPAAADGLRAPDTNALKVSDWKNTTHPQLNGQPLQLKPYEMSRSLAIAPDHQSFLLGTEWLLRRFDANGREKWNVPVPGVVWGVNISGDGSKAVAAFGDGTIRWYDYQTGQELLAFFPHNDGKRWVLWTPEGFFDASPGAEGLIGFHLNRGKDQAAEFIALDQMYRLFYRPDLVTAHLTGDDAAITAALKAIGGNVQAILNGDLPPHPSLDGVAEERIDGEHYELRVRVNAKEGDYGRIIYRLNGVTLPDVQGRSGKPQIPGRHSRAFDLLPNINILCASVLNRSGTAESEQVCKTVIAPEVKEVKSDLYVLTVGAGEYYDSDLTLEFAVDDAYAFANTLGSQSKPLFGKIHINTLNNDRVTLDNIERAFHDWSKVIRKQDVFVLYIAGHGSADDGQYHFLPYNFVYENVDSLAQGTLTQDNLNELLQSIPAQKSLVVLDTCDSGAALPQGRGLNYRRVIGNLMRSTGRAFLTATTDNQMALEGYEGHGVFTFALLQGLQKEADSDGDGLVYINELAGYVMKKVPELTFQKWQRHQLPSQDLNGQDFPIAAIAP